MKKVFVNILLLSMSISMAAAPAGQAQKGKSTSAAGKTAAGKSQKFEGWISDEKCGAKIDAECAKKCQANGVKMVFVDNDKKQVIPVENQDALKDLAGQHVNIKGKMENGALKVESAKATPEPGK